MTITTLDVASLPDWFEYQGVQLEDLVRSIRQTVEFWGQIGLVRTVDSFGFAVAFPHTYQDTSWDDPTAFVSFVGGWGDDADAYVANAVRKMRAAVREGEDTLTLVDDGSGRFLNPAEPRDGDGPFPWGDFPYGGAAYTNCGNDLFLVGVSALSQEEDDLVAAFIGKLISKTRRTA